MDTVRRLAEERHFFTADLQLADYGQVLLIGDQEAVERVLAVLGEHKNHTVLSLPAEEDSPPDN
jgi:hypothetical protein